MIQENILTYLSQVLHFTLKQVIDLRCKLNDWFVYEMQRWVEMG